MAPEAEFNKERKDAAIELVKLFNWERYTYLGLSVVTAIFILCIGIQTIMDPSRADRSTVVYLFGSGGLVTYNIGRLLAMFSKVFDAVLEK